MEARRRVPLDMVADMKAAGAFGILRPRSHGGSEADLPSADSIGAGVFNPSASIVAVGDAYRVDGRWSFASGCEHADWLSGNCIEVGLDGTPQMRIAVFTPDEVVIEDTWDVAGLRGTGSHHFHVDGVVVPASRTFVPMSGNPCVDTPIVRCPIPSLFALCIGSVALGIAQGAVDDIRRSRCPQGSARRTAPPGAPRPTPIAHSSVACATSAP